MKEIIPWEKPVDGQVLLGEAVAYIGRYLVLPKGALDVMVLWAMHCHAFDAAKKKTQMQQMREKKMPSLEKQAYNYLDPNWEPNPDWWGSAATGQD